MELRQKGKTVCVSPSGSDFISQNADNRIIDGVPNSTDEQNRHRIDGLKAGNVIEEKGKKESEDRRERTVAPIPQAIDQLGSLGEVVFLRVFGRRSGGGML